MLSDDELLRYSRHLLMPEFGDQAQEVWRSSKVSVIGCGGLGNPAALYLASSGVGQLQLFDLDRIELSNLQRQIGFATINIGQSKAHVLAERLRSLNPHVAVTVMESYVSEKLSGQALECLLASDVILDCTDNFGARYWVNRLSRQQQIPLVSAAATGMQGVVGVFNQSPQSPCYNCLFDERDEAEQQQSCAEAGVFAPLLGQLGALQASMALELLCGQVNSQQSLILNWVMRPLQVRQMLLKADKACSVCGSV